MGLCEQINHLGEHITRFREKLDREKLAKVLARYDDEGDPDCPPQIVDGEWSNPWARERWVGRADALIKHFNE